MSTVPVFAPDGTLGDIPAEKLQDAVKAGFKPGVNMIAADGSKGVVPADRYVDAAKGGLKVAPFQEQEIQHPGFWASLGEDLKAMVTPKPGALGDQPLPGRVAAGEHQRVQDIAQQSAADEWRKQAGYSKAYRVAAPVAEGLGVNVPGMEKSAQEGDAAGVLGHAAAVPAVMAATEGLKPAVGMVAKTAGPVAERLYQSALKPSTRMGLEKAQQVVRTGLENKVPVSEAGLDHLNGLIDDLNDKIKQTVASDPTKTVNKFAVTSRLADTADKFSNQVNSAADLRAISKSGNEFLKEQPGQIPAQDAQALKTGTYQQLRGKYGQLSSAAIEAQKALARGLKEELAKAFPELSGLNSSESKLISLDSALEKAVQRIGNHQVMGIGTPIAAGAAKAVTGSTGWAAVTGLVKAIVDDPAVKSRLAVALNTAGKGATTLAQAHSRLAAYSAALAATSEAGSDRKSEKANGQ